MGECCKCEATNVGWSDPQESVWEDSNTGKSYCIYHAPKDKKFKSKGSVELFSAQEFNALVYRRIDTAIAGKIACDLQYCIFPGEIDFSRYETLNPFPDINFASTEFFGFSNFIDCHFSGLAYFSDAIFHERTSFRSVTFVGEADFSFAEFKSIALFDLARIKDRLIFVETVFSAQIDLYATEFENAAKMLCVGLTKDSIKNLCYTRVQLLHMEFQNSRWPMRLGLDLFFSNDKEYILECEELYRAMKQRAAEEHDQPLVSRWHFREKLMQLKQLFDNDRSNNLLEEVEDHDAKWSARTKAWFKLLWHRPHWQKFTLTGLYWATSGFGERAVRAGVWLLALLLLPFIANSPIGHSLWQFWNWMPGVSNLSEWVQNIGDAINASAAMQYVPFTKDIPGFGWAKVGQALWHGVILLQFTLFALAVRNRFRR